MVIAAEAYHELPERTRSKVDEILKAHPDYAKWVATHSKEKFADLSLSEYVFLRASKWPDEIRRAKGQGSRSYDHPHWHYVDYPLKPTKFPLEPGPSPKDDLLYGIAQCEKNLCDSKASPEEKAVYLSYLIHLVGDVHQPLHCCSLVNETYPNGDKGGNDFYVKPGNKGIKLHSFWDGLLGTSSKPQTQIYYAIELLHDHPRKSLPELAKATTPKDWSLEGRQIAIDKAYLRADINGGCGTSEQNACELPSNYTKEAKAVAENRAALAGYRLADEIQMLIK